MVCEMEKASHNVESDREENKGKEVSKKSQTF